MTRVFLVGLFALEVSGWGHEGHREITRIALESLSDDRVARKYLRDHLGGIESIIQASGWADTKEAAQKYPGSEDLHFSNTPWRDCSAFNITRDCGFGGSGECIVTGIADMSMVAVDPTRGRDDRVDALKFLLHLVADIHQPLHTGFAEDNGGGNIMIQSEPLISLHQMWDYGLLEQAEEASGKAATASVPYEAAAIVVPETLDDRENVLQFASDLATESSTRLTCQFAYRNEAGRFIKSKDKLSQAYMSSRKQIARQRVEVAGARLADFVASLARTFSMNEAKISADSQRATASAARALVFQNRFAELAIELEPDDLVEESALVIQAVRSASRSPKPPKKKAAAEDSTGLEQFLPEAPPMKIGDVEVSDLVLVKTQERYWLTCARLYKDNPEYEPMHATTFRVRFTKNQKRTDPILFFADTFCFGRGLREFELVNALYQMTGNVGSALTLSSKAVVSATRSRQSDTLDIYPIYEEFAEKISLGIATGRYVRGWSPLYEGDHAITIGYLGNLRSEHTSFQLRQIQMAEAQNITLDVKLDRDFYFKRSSILLYTFGRLQIVIHKQTLTNPDNFEMRFSMFGCVARSGRTDDPFFTTLIDTNIFDGPVTPRILKGISALALSQGQNPDPTYQQRPTFLHELEDIEKLLYGKGISRSNSFKAIKGYYMYPSIISENMAYLEWTLTPYLFQPAGQEPVLPAGSTAQLIFPPRSSA